MCGIAGYISMSDKTPNKTNLEEMFKAIEVRGRDASGFATLTSKKLNVTKAPLMSSKLITKKSWKQLTKLPPIMIMHTRAATQGDIKINTNNHPLTYKNITAIHNGVIQNEADFGIPNTDVDSMAILKSWYENKGNINEVFGSLQGGFAVALLDSTQSDTLKLFRHTNPIELLFDQQDEILYFASTTIAVNKAKQKYEKLIKGFYINDRYQEIDFPNNSYMELNRKEGVIDYVEDLTVKPTIWQQNYNAHETRNKNYHSYYGAQGSESYYDGYTEGYHYTPNNTVKDNSSDTLFLEFKEPSFEADYIKVNEKLKTSAFSALKCPHCKRATLVDAREKEITCNQCKHTITEEELSVN